MGRRSRKRGVPQETADLLGLLAPARLPPASRVGLTTHAVARFRERLFPELSQEEAYAELRRLKRGARVVRTRPVWLPGVETQETVGYIILRGTPCAAALAIERREGDRYVAPTCLIASGRAG
jgi:hypothetical protein